MGVVTNLKQGRIMNKITKAKEIAIQVHSDQVDKKNYPYLAHVYDVAKRVSKLGESYEIVGLLHDAIEDASPDDFKEHIVSEIIEYFDDEIYLAILAMSKTKGEDYFEEYLPKVKANQIALNVKIADASHNLSKAHLIEDQDLQDKLRNKYVKALNELGVDGRKCEKPIRFFKGEWQEI